jgi:hypothetical protein
MASGNDAKILGLKKQIEEKKKTIKSTEKFVPITNCSIELDGTRFNIQVLTRDQIVDLMVKLNSYRLSAKDLSVKYFVCGYSVEDWITDLRSRLGNLERKTEERRLKVLEDKLHDLLSTDKKVELEIDEIASSI